MHELVESFISGPKVSAFVLLHTRGASADVSCFDESTMPAVTFKMYLGRQSVGTIREPTGNL